MPANFSREMRALPALLAAARVQIRDEPAKRATGGDARRYDAMYRAAVDETDNETKRLNERTEEVRNNFSQGVEAVEALKDLYRILDVKLRVTRRDMAGESLGQTTTYGGANVLSM